MKNFAIVKQSIWSQCHSDILAYLQRSLECDLKNGTQTLRSCRLVNRHWYKEFCKSMTQLTPRLRSFTFWDLSGLRKFSNLKKLTLRDDYIVSDAWLHELSKVVPQLEVLALRFIGNGAGWKGSISNSGIMSLQKLKNLVHLEVAGSQFNGSLCIEALSHLRKLTYLDLSENKLNRFAIEPLTKLENLETFVLAGNTDLENLKDGWILQFTKLKYLSLRGCVSITDIDIQSLSSLTSLTGLDLRMCSKIKGTSLASFTSVQLVHLNLMGCLNLNETNLKFLTDFQFLKFLDLRMCPLISNNGLELLKNLPSLMDLRIGGENVVITDMGLSYLPQLPCLKYLTLFFMDDITYKGMEYVCLCESLQKLTIVHCQHLTLETIYSFSNRQHNMTIDLHPSSASTSSL